MPQLAIENVVKAYDSKLAVDRVSFEVNGGEVFGLLMYGKRPTIPEL